MAKVDQKLLLRPLIVHYISKIENVFLIVLKAYHFFVKGNGK